MSEIKPHRGPVGENEALVKNHSEWLHFANPYRLITAERLEDVLPALQAVERLVQVNDWYAAGFLSYEAASAFDSALQTHDLTSFPYLWFGLYPEPRQVKLPAPEGEIETLNWQPTIKRDLYEAAIEKIKEYISQGQTYQVNHTMRLEVDFPGNAWDFFLRLIQNQNRHAAYIDTGRYVICSASPELFFELDGDTITCCPMKGTTRRGRTTSEDHAQADWLKHSAKNRAENVMIVDMIRNDLGRIAEIGSVCVPDLFHAERYATLWQMTSTVTAKTSASLTEIFAALFPCASITGAPKVNTMRIITELENTARRIYTGSIGYISPRRAAKFNVAIRTALIDRQEQKAEYGAGGGIVWDSVHSDEYDEALLKAQILTEAQPPFSLLETILWTPIKGFFLLEKHVARMLDSADYFGIPTTKQKLEEFVQKISSSFSGPQRVRVLLDHVGKLEHEASRFESGELSTSLNVCLARQPIDSNNIFLFHKTTQRDIYNAARNGLEKFDDIVLYNQFGELTEFTIGNLVVELEGQLFTPPISCGVLPGTFRAHLVETGQVLERTIPLEQLKNCTKAFRVNSIRGWQRVTLRSQTTVQNR
jgi:para-aminobenzoate synthetase/4-amino-4-deoxychorismate lyase